MAHTFSKQLVAGTPENVNDVMTDLNEAAADWEGAFSSYKVLQSGTALSVASSASSYLFSAANSLQAANGSFGGGGLAPGIFYLNPADLTASPRTNKFQLRVFALTNATAPAANFTFSLNQIATSGGGAGVITYTSVAVAGSAVTITSPSANTTTQNTAGDFTAPTAGWYCVIVSLNAGQAANSAAQLGYQLLNRQV